MQRILLMHKRFLTVFKHTSTILLQCLFAALVGDILSEQAVYDKRGLQLISKLQRHVDNLSVRAHLIYASHSPGTRSERSLATSRRNFPTRDIPVTGLQEWWDIALDDFMVQLQTRVRTFTDAAITAAFAPFDIQTAPNLGIYNQMINTLNNYNTRLQNGQGMTFYAQYFVNIHPPTWRYMVWDSSIWDIQFPSFLSACHFDKEKEVLNVCRQ